MKKLIVIIAVIGLASLFAVITSQKRSIGTAVAAATVPVQEPSYKPVPFDSLLIADFFLKYPELNKYSGDVKKLYQKHHYNYVWFEKNRINEAGNILYIKIQNIEDEGVFSQIPYKEKVDVIFKPTEGDQVPNVNDELLISSLYFFYTDKVYTGVADEKRAEMNWFLSREKQSFVNYLDSLLTNPSLLHKDEKEVFGQYFRLREMLKKYNEIDKSREWKPIQLDTKVKAIHPGDSSSIIAQIRLLLFLTSDIDTDSGSNIYDKELEDGVIRYKKRNDFTPDNIILPKHIESMNIPPSERSKTIIVNMERNRWMCNCISDQTQLILINIPSYQLDYYKNGKKELTSNVIVGKVLNKTVVFNADMKYIVFSPYWNVPSSILNKEILPAIAENRNYLSEHDMEWHDGKVRQRPGSQNSLGRVKFLFPNNNSIYLHDTPHKDLFKEEKRAFSHGCIRVEKPVELANLILKEDPNWTAKKIEAAMNRDSESWYTLKATIPVYIGYFTAWVDDEGAMHFYDDIYERDKALADLLFINKPKP